MSSLTIKLPESQEQWLRDEAARRDTIEELISEALKEYEHRVRRPRTLRAEGAGGSGQSDISVRIEELIAAEWGKE